MGKKLLAVLVIAAGVITAYVLIDDAKTNTDGIQAVKTIQADKSAAPKQAAVAGAATASANPNAEASANAQSTVSAETPNPVANNSNNNKTMELEIKTTQEGTGQAVKAGDTVSVLYIGKLLDGTVFDASVKHGNTPFEFTVGAGMVIKGWDQGLLGAKVGEKRTLTIPGDLAYGPQGIPGTIPPNATLLFDIEVLAIK